MTVDLERAKAGDERAFASLVEPFRRELQLHCYRLLGSVQDAEDLVQETLLAAWCGLDRFEERASLRSWLYRIATNRSLNAIRERGRRPTTENTMRPSKTRRAVEPSWLEPYPDNALPDPAPGPEARYEQREAIQLSFIVALQQLPAKQRAALVLRDVLGFHTDEAASILETTPQSVKAGLQRACDHAAATARAHRTRSDRRVPRRPRRGARRPATATPDPRQRPAGLRLLPALAAPGHDGAHPERQQGRPDHLLRRPHAARPLRSSQTHLADKDGFDVKWKRCLFGRRNRRGRTPPQASRPSRRRSASMIRRSSSATDATRSASSKLETSTAS